MKKILEIFGEPILRGGQESYVMNNLQYMDMEGMKIDLLTPYYCENTNYLNFINNNGGKIYCLNLPFRIGKSRHNIIKVMEKFFQNNTYDIVHIHSGSTSVLAYASLVAKKAGVKKVIIHSHSSGMNETFKHLVIKKYANILFKKNVDIYCACSYEAAKWKYSKDIVENNTIILKNGIDCEKYKYNVEIRNKIRKEYKIDEDTYVIGHVGRFTYEKNQMFLLDVFFQYQLKNPNSMLIFVGDGELFQKAKDRCKTLNIVDKVIFVGSVDKVSDYLQAFDIFAFPSLFEGFGIVAVEAQASGLPVIASDNIPKEIKLMKNVEFISLDDINKWLYYLNKLRIVEDRSESWRVIKKSGYEIRDTALEVKNIYLNS